MPAPVANSALAAAVAAYVGIYREEFAIPLVTAAPDEPQSAPPDPRAQYVNTITGDTYTEAARFRVTRTPYPDDQWKAGLAGFHDSDAHSDAALMLCASASTLVLAFRFGMVRHRSEVLDVAAQYYTQLKAAVEGGGGVPCAGHTLVLCGHSEGGAVAEAVALLRASDPSFGLALESTFLVSTASHLWMLESETQAVVRAFEGRCVSYGTRTLLRTAYDPFLAKFDALDRYTRAELDARQLVSLPKTLCRSGECVEVGSLRGLEALAGFECADNVYIGQGLHCWESYEAAITPSLSTPSVRQLATAASD